MKCFIKLRWKRIYGIEKVKGKVLILQKLVMLFKSKSINF